MSSVERLDELIARLERAGEPEGERRLAGQQPPAVDPGGGIGQSVGDCLKGADGHPKGVPLLHVLDTDLDGAAPDPG